MLYPSGTTTEPQTSSNFGPRIPIWTSGGWTGSYHYGCDYIGLDRLHAIAAGKVIGVGVLRYWEGAGIQVLIDHGNGVYSRYFHMASYAVKNGQQVSEGQFIGYADSTGKVTGKHLHLQVHVGGTGNGNAVDPRAYIKARLGGSGGGGNPTGTQRVAGPNGVRRRIGAPSTSSSEGEMLAPGVVGNFNGWIRGEKVDGNDVWFRGISGDFFWSGGFTDKGTHDLADLNPAKVGPKQRKTTAELRGRAEPTTSSEIKQVLPEGTIGDFDGWRNGEAVGTERRWLRGAHSGDWFSLAYLEPRNVDNLSDLNPVSKPATGERTTVANGSNGRKGPGTSFAIAQTLAGGVTGTFDAYARGQAVEGNDVWFRGAINGNWFWSGGFTSTSTDGLTLIVDLPDEPDEVTPIDKDNPRGLKEYTPFFPLAKKGLTAPLGDGSRATKGTPPVPVPVVKIDRYIVHHTATTADQLDYFSYKNDRSVCPTFYLRTDGTVFELIRPGMKPAATGAEWNYRSIATETQNKKGAPGWEGTDEQIEAHAQIAAWLYSFDGKELDGTPVDFKLDREHIIGHYEALATECPGPWFKDRLDDIVTRAIEIAGKADTPAEDYVQVKRDDLLAIRDMLDEYLT